MCTFIEIINKLNCLQLFFGTELIPNRLDIKIFFLMITFQIERIT